MEKRSGWIQKGPHEAILDYITGDPIEIAKRWEYGYRYEDYPTRLLRAAELLGQGNTYYPDLMARYHYFKGLNKRLQAEEAWQNTELFQEALDLQFNALQWDGDASFVLNEIGVLYLKLKESRRAITYLKKANNISPKWSLPYNNLGAAYREIMKYDSASYFIKEAGKIDSSLVFIPLNLGLIAEEQEDFVVAEKYYREVIKKHPQYGFASLLLGWLLLDLDRLDEAEEVIRTFISIEPENPQGYTRLGLIKQKQGNSTAAVEVFRKAIELNPEYSSPYLHLGRIYAGEMADYEQALSYFMRYQKLQPDNEEVLLRLVMLYTQMDETEKAVIHLKKAKEMGISDSNEEWIRTDPGLEKLRELEEFEIILDSSGG